MRGRAADLLAAGEVDEVELPAELLLRFDVLLLHVDEEDAVTARTVLVHVCDVRSSEGQGSTRFSRCCFTVPDCVCLLTFFRSTKLKLLSILATKNLFYS